MAYLSDFQFPLRRLTQEVQIGDLKLGGQNPILAQSMTTTDTKDAKATVEQIRRLKDVGCPLVRLTTPTAADVENTKLIKAEMKRQGFYVPLVADVHFLPKVAMRAVEVFDKVRVNPGNFADTKRFKVLEYTDAQYAQELDRIREAFAPLVRRAKELGVAMRIGTNHGSLSDRILNRYGDTPMGMVESALEFLRIGEDEGFNQMIVSMKSSNPMVMIQAYRLLVDRMDAEGMHYPLHLGVTEAGDGEDGRIKSALGIGSLLRDGLGDTVRVSLTEEPEAEIPVAKDLIRLFARPFSMLEPDSRLSDVPFDPFAYKRRDSQEIHVGAHDMGGGSAIRVVGTLQAKDSAELEKAVTLGDDEDAPVEVLLQDVSMDHKAQSLMPMAGRKTAVGIKVQEGSFADLAHEREMMDVLEVAFNPLFADAAYAPKLKAFLGDRPVFFNLNARGDFSAFSSAAKDLAEVPYAWGVVLEGTHVFAPARKLSAILSNANIDAPLVLRLTLDDNVSESDAILKAAVDLGGPLADGIGDAVDVNVKGITLKKRVRLAFDVLQAARLRLSKTEYIACPSCGRTLFDLQETTARIRSKTHHLKGVKIAVMGCIVNGPGEMADADFGYVGSKPGLINLYVGQECVEKNIDQSQADQRLIELIREHGRWTDPKPTNA